MYKLVLLFVALIFISSCSKSEPAVKSVEVQKPSSSEVKDKNQDVSAKFWKLVSQQKIKEVIDLANTLVKDNSGEVPGFYKQLFKQEKINESVLSRKEFNEVDAFFWVQAQFFNQIALELKLKSKKADLIKNIFSLVRQKVKREGDGDDISAYPLHIWQRGFGVCDRQAWVFCEIAYQLGAKTSIIYLMDPVKGTSPHTMCEVEYEGIRYVVDTLYDIFLPNKTFTDLSDEIIKEVWSEKPELHNSFKGAIRQVPSMPTDYAERNQRLTARLGNKVRFAEPPQNRYHFWKAKSPDMKIRFWGYPIRLLQVMNIYKNAEK